MQEEDRNQCNGLQNITQLTM